jgi:hypothetical protein
MIYALSETLDEGVGLGNFKILLCVQGPWSNIYLTGVSPANVVFAGIGVLLIVSTFRYVGEPRRAEVFQAARDVSPKRSLTV